MKNSNRREDNRTAKTRRIAAWSNNKVQPDLKEESQITPKTNPKVTALGYIGRLPQPEIATSETTGALTPNYVEEK
jgi:hypothetical protein